MNYDIYKLDIENRLGGAHAITFTQDGSIFTVTLKDGAATLQVSHSADKIYAIKKIWQTQFGNEPLIPCLTIAQRDSITAALGQQILNIDEDYRLEWWDGTQWVFDSKISVVIVVDEKANGVHGGTFTSGAWQTRDLNTLKVNDGSIASLDNNQVTFPAGIYECWVMARAYDVAMHVVRLQDITGAITLTYGIPVFASSTSNSNDGFSSLYMKFTLSVSSALEIQHRCSATSTNTQGFGIAANIGVVETHVWAMFRKVG